MSGRWILLTFGAGLPNWRAAARRVAEQGSRSKWFHEIHAYNERILRHEFPAFTCSHAQVLRASTRGFGWWIWKPFLIRESLRACAAQGLEGVVYVDGGCEINYHNDHAADRFQGYLDRAADEQGVFAMHLPQHVEHAWTRAVVMDHFGLTQELRSAPQVQATIVIADTRAISLADEWLVACTRDDYALVKDAPTGETNASSFHEHRHDQSIFSSLLKSRSIATVPDETFWAPVWQVDGARFPLWAARNRTRISVADSRPVSRGIRFAELAYSRGHREVSTRLRGARL